MVSRDMNGLSVECRINLLTRVWPYMHFYILPSKTTDLCVSRYGYVLCLRILCSEGFSVELMVMRIGVRDDVMF